MLGEVVAAGQTSPPATVEDLANLEFEGLASPLAGDMEPMADWLNTAKGHYFLLKLALVMLERDHVGAADDVGKAPDLMLEFLEGLASLSEVLRDRVDVLDTARVRLMAALARHDARQAT